jgi:hypothetical protein
MLLEHGAEINAVGKASLAHAFGTMIGTRGNISTKLTYQVIFERKKPTKYHM